MGRSACLWFLISTAALIAISSGCGGPTYRKEHLAQSLQKMLDEQDLATSVRALDQTLVVHVEHPDTLNQTGDQIGIGPAFDEAIPKVIMAVHRVLLSTDAPIKFYVLLASDPNIPGAYLTLIRYVEDIRRANVNIINETEMLLRTIFDIGETGGQSLSLDQLIPRDILMEEFLSWQLAKRIESRLVEELEKRDDLIIGQCLGEFRYNQFVFTLSVESISGGEIDDDLLQELFQISTDTIAPVLEDYEFEAFDSVQFVHLPTGRNLVLPRTRLNALP